MIRNFIKIFIVCLILLFSFAFKVGDQVELENYLHARSSANFTKNSNNIQTTLEKGIKGEVLEAKKLPSGNFAIKMKVENGSQQGKTYWVYYNVKTPALKIYDKNKQEINSNKLSKAASVALSIAQKAYRDPDEASIEEAAKTAVQVLNPNSIQEIVKIPKKPDCAQPITIVAENKYSVSDIVEPYREINDSFLGSKTCSTTGEYTVCKQNDKIESFQLSNDGPNNIVKTHEYYINRTMSFEFEDRARSDIKLVIADGPDEFTSHVAYSVMLFFPRTVLPAIKQVGNELEVTLPNKEIVRYNAKTREILGGVFEEKPIQQDPKNKNKALPPGIKYTGNGIMIRADKTGDLPYGDIETRDGKTARSVTIATVSKKGFKDCKIPSKDIWYTREDRGGNTFIKPELANDQGVDLFIKKRCGFSLY